MSIRHVHVLLFFISILSFDYFIQFYPDRIINFQTYVNISKAPKMGDLQTSACNLFFAKINYPKFLIWIKSGQNRCQNLIKEHGQTFCCVKHSIVHSFTTPFGPRICRQIFVMFFEDFSKTCIVQILVIL